MMSVYVFPVAVMFNLSAMMILMIALSLFRKPEMAADVGLVHAATVALFYSFSANARSLIISGSTSSGVSELLRLRLLLLLPLCLLVWLLCGGSIQGQEGLIVLLILRRAAEWLAEIFLSEQERQQRFSSSVSFVSVQCVALIMVSAAMIFDVAVLEVTFIWACSPLLSCMGSRLLQQVVVRSTGMSLDVRKLLPHFGSTLAIGASVYFFRLYLILLLGKQGAGDLFAAFAFGGIMGAVFAQALGPTMVHNEASLKNCRLRKLFNIFLLAITLSGIALAFAIWRMPELLAWTAKSHVFWMAVSCSLVGGGVMVLAQKLRLQLLQSSGGRDVFGSDVLANLLLVMCVPILYFGMGDAYLASLYLVGAVLSLVFYLSEDWSEIMGKCRGSRIALCLRRGVGANAQKHGWGMLLLVAGLFVPIFFQWKHGIFHEGVYYESDGSLESLPLPLSLIFCYVAIVLMGGYARARRVLLVIFFSFVVMSLGALLLTGDTGAGININKLVLLVQYVLPMFALIVGVQAGSLRDALHGLARGVLVVLLVVTGLQLVATLLAGQQVLSSSALVFGVYQSLQYVPVIFVGGYLIVLYTLWGDASAHGWLFLLGGLIGGYTALSISLLALSLLLVGGLIFIMANLTAGAYRVRVVLLAALLMTGFGGGIAYSSGSPLFAIKFTVPFTAAEPAAIPSQVNLPAATGAAQPLDSITPAQSVAAAAVTEAPLVSDESKNLALPRNLVERVAFWDFYVEGVQESWRAFLLGHEHPPERSTYPSAHNYYLDFVYNFGFLALLPLLMLILHTIYSVGKSAGRIWGEPGILAITLVLLFILLIDNSLKVGMRQPYPGIVSFFLWGFLLAWLWRFEEAPRT
ncbi:hypothetical protein [Pseudomonas sichuanensis]|uniref:hypothetical protein n=1 Tax=Pseudomonas sichuanensis TaxID=2213015 RepID=UPI00215E06CB|nr:hypothetical protein [Pseudomonas sichuanensis]UVL90726.1 hypothetical protein LOY51_07480 [Pseudomonas sichuanensis]